MTIRFLANTLIGSHVWQSGEIASFTAAQEATQISAGAAVPYPSAAGLSLAVNAPVGSIAYNAQIGQPVFSNGLAWQSLNAAPNSAQRPPVLSDNANWGFSTSSAWQYGGDLYTPAAYCGNDAAAWTSLNTTADAGTPVDVMTAAITKFAGGTCSMLKGFTGPAIDIAVTVGGVYQISTINILATGELDNVAMGAALSLADANTNALVLKVYDQSGNNNHAVLCNAAGIQVFAASATVTTSTTLTINSGQTGTIAAAQFVFGNGITAGVTVASGAGPYVLSGAGAPSNPAAIAVYFGITSPPYIDWDPILGRYVIYSPNEQTNITTTNKRALQIVQTATFTSTRNVGFYAVGAGVSSSGGGNAPCLCAMGDSQVAPSNYWVCLGSTSTNPNQWGNIWFLQNGSARQAIVSVQNQPCVVLAYTAATPLATVSVNETTATTSAAITDTTLAGGYLFTYGGSAFGPYSMMKLVGLAMFNAAPTAAQAKALRYGAYTRFNIFPQVQNQVALIGDSRFENLKVTPEFGVGCLLPRYLSRNWNVINLAVRSTTAATQIGDGLVPTLTGVAKSLANYKGPGLNYAVILLGVNDILLNNSSVAAVVGFLQTYCAQIAAAGWTPILVSEMATTTVTNNVNTQLPLLHAAIMAQGTAGMGCAAIIDLYGYTPVITPANTSYYYDGLHPTLATHQMMASAIAQAIPAAY